MASGRKWWRALCIAPARSCNRVFLPVNCGAIAEALLESQFFGHRRGAFTGAVTDEQGLFRCARGSTIFLDEIADLPLSGQCKLLRVIESKEILPVGASAPLQVEVRVIAATNRDLRHEVDAGRFREDLYYRLNVVNIEIPPLRERREAIPALVEHLVRLHNRRLKKSVKGVESATLRLLVSLPFKGNVRELDNIIEHAMTLSQGDMITIRDLPAHHPVCPADRRGFLEHHPGRPTHFPTGAKPA